MSKALIRNTARLLAARDISKAHRNQILCHLRRFADRYEDTFDALNDENVNAWLGELEQTSLAKKTRRAYRASVLNAWRTLYHARLFDRPPGEIRPVRSPSPPPTAWTLEELRALLRACDVERDRTWVRAFILVLWSTGLRPQDATRVRVCDLSPGNVWHFVQEKTQHPHSVKLSDEAVEALREAGGSIKPKPRSSLSKIFRRLRERANVRYGTARTIRRSAASYVELEQPGAASKLLGHRSPAMAYRHYVDPSITATVVSGPSALLSA